MEIDKLKGYISDETIRELAKCYVKIYDEIENKREPFLFCGRISYWGAPEPYVGASEEIAEEIEHIYRLLEIQKLANIWREEANRQHGPRCPF